MASYMLHFLSTLLEGGSRFCFPQIIKFLKILFTQTFFFLSVKVVISCMILIHVHIQMKFICSDRLPLMLLKRYAFRLTQPVLMP
jgi:hypothetical protein